MFRGLGLSIALIIVYIANLAIGVPLVALVWVARRMEEKKTESIASSGRLLIAQYAFTISVLLNVLLLALGYLSRSWWEGIPFLGEWLEDVHVRIWLLMISFGSLCMSITLSYRATGPGKWTLQVAAVLMFVIGLIGVVGLIADPPSF